MSVDEKRVLVTGANGFVGSAVMRRLVSDVVHSPMGAVRRPAPQDPGSTIVVGELSAGTDWSAALQGVDAVVHTAARAHVMKDASADPLAEFRRVNVDGTLALARQAAGAGVRRFVFVSSIKVNGEETSKGERFHAHDTSAPEDAYGISKREAEDGLFAVSRQTGMEVVIVRPPLVYGAGVKGNFASMMRWVSKGVPLPLGAVNNRRSLVALDNLVDLITTCIDHPAAANEVFLVSDGEDISTTELLQRVGKAMERPARLIPVPPRLLEVAAAMLGKRDVACRLLGSLQVDISKTHEVLGWEPPISVDEGVRRAVEPLKRRRGGSSGFTAKIE
ncbi:NAD-dependent epimerase/dehydratase family protein [Guyparkeria halophila]|uniref:NAD-dependent epimerase/dehydratase family protein n=1 Tax=Guyparkeria halophila TaxID=47960 RepID=A0A6I6D9V5_9GAMM|nr:SDR family oxidoreductase [Guyparkeria halophila]QGT78312.1 NAD-dependent epimerase/dehydratase family protein [Guyparkeria halophila]